MDIDLKDRYIDNNFWRVTPREAYKLAKEGPNGKIPRQGYECRVYVNGCPCWLTRTKVNGEQVWAVHTSWDPVHLSSDTGKEVK